MFSWSNELHLPTSIHQLLVLPQRTRLVRDQIIGLDSPLYLIKNVTRIDMARLGSLLLLSRLGPVDSATYNVAASSGQTKILAYMDANKNYHGDRWTSVLAAEGGHIEVLEYLYNAFGTQYSLFWNERACRVAIANDHLEVLKYIYERLPVNNISSHDHINILNDAVIYNRLEFVRYLHKNGCPWNEGVMCIAATYSRLDILKYLRNCDCKERTCEPCPWSTEVCCAAAENNELEVLKYLHENGCPWDVDACTYAACEGYLEVLKYLYENGCPCDERVCEVAALYGELEILKYLHENGCPWDSISCNMAAENNYLDILKYLHENGCPWDECTSIAAVQGANLDILRYLHENSCPMNIDDCLVMARRLAIQEIVVWLESL